jgi:hemin uptake protein HemP
VTLNHATSCFQIILSRRAASATRLSNGHWNDLKMSAGSQKRSPSDRTEAPSEIPPARMIAVVAHKIDSLELFAGAREIIITHGGDSYRLRLTGQNKLILTK